MKSKLPLIIAIVIGIVALLSIRSYVKQVENKAADRLKGEPVVAAKVDIAAGSELSMAQIEAKQVPPQFIPPQAIQDVDQVKQIMGRKTRVNIKAGQIILWSDLASETRGGFSTVIPAGLGAFTVSISRGIKSSLIQANDSIDVIGSFTLPKSTQPMPNTMATWRQSSDMVNIVLLQNVTVLAVGDTFGGAVRSGGSTGSDVTLALTLAEAQLLMFAAQHGELGAVLRKSLSREIQPRDQLPKITFEAIEKVIGDLDGRRNVRIVEVERGGAVESIPVIKAPPGQGEKK